jgi:hypothetical protein
MTAFGTTRICLSCLRRPVLCGITAGDLAVETIAGDLMYPWSLAFLPDGRMLVTERPGRMRIVTRAGQIPAWVRRRMSVNGFVEHFPQNDLGTTCACYIYSL